MSSNSRKAIKSIIASGANGITETPTGYVMDVNQLTKWLEDNPNTLMGTMHRMRDKLPRLYPADTFSKLRRK